MLCLSFFSASAQDVVRLSLNNKFIGEVTTGSTPAVLEVPRARYKNIKKLDLEFKQGEPVAAYKRLLEISDNQQTQICLLNESDKAGHYVITSLPVLKKLLKENDLKVYLLQNPKDNRMSMPSRRTLLVELHIK